MRLMIKAAGQRTIVVGSTGCMYVANTTYYSTPWVVPWMHTQLGSSGSAATGTAAGLASMMRKGKMHKEPINVIAFCGDGGGADMGLAAISAALQHDEYNLLILMYDNESYANTDIQASGSTPYGANTTFSPPGKETRIMNNRWKKNTALEPVKVRAPTEEACLTISNWECSLSATMKSQSKLPSALSRETYCITVS